MAIRINQSGLVSGTFDLSDYPFTMLFYFQADESSPFEGDIFTIGDDVNIFDMTSFHQIIHSSDDDLTSFSIVPPSASAVGEVTGNNPIDTDFSTWWAVMMSIKEDGITVEHNIWSGVGSNANLLTGTITLNSLTGLFVPIGTGVIGSFSEKFINIQEVVLVDKALTTGQLNLWAHGVPAPQANFPGNIIFYQPLVTGYNEPTSVGVVGATGTGSLVIESVVGPLMFGGTTVTSTVGDITTLAQWADIQTDANGNVLSTDIGQLSNNLSLFHGSESGQVSNLYHTIITGTSGVADVYDLSDLSDSHINIILDRSFLTVKSISVQNLATGVGQYLDFDVSSSSGFGQMFGEPNQPITIYPKSCLQRGDSYTGYLVDNNNRVLEITAQSTGVVYEMVILGN